MSQHRMRRRKLKKAIKVAAKRRKAERRQRRVAPAT